MFNFAKYSSNKNKAVKIYHLTGSQIEGGGRLRWKVVALLSFILYLFVYFTIIFKVLAKLVLAAKLNETDNMTVYA